MQNVRQVIEQWKRFILIVAASVALAACTGTDSTLGVNADNQTDDTVPQVSNLPDPPAGGANVYFAPIVGAPVDKVTALSRQLSASAPAANIQLSAGRASNLNHEIRGYFSALAEGNTTTIIHVWDVFTPDGQRVHRIQGQETLQGASTDPWAQVPAETMASIGNKVIAQYNQWRASAQRATTAG